MNQNKTYKVAKIEGWKIENGMIVSWIGLLCVSCVSQLRRMPLKLTTWDKILTTGEGKRLCLVNVTLMIAQYNEGRDFELIFLDNMETKWLVDNIPSGEWRIHWGDMLTQRLVVCFPSRCKWFLLSTMKGLVWIYKRKIIILRKLTSI